MKNMIFKVEFKNLTQKIFIVMFSYLQPLKEQGCPVCASNKNSKNTYKEGYLLMKVEVTLKEYQILRSS